MPDGCDAFSSRAVVVRGLGKEMVTVPDRKTTGDRSERSSRAVDEYAGICSVCGAISAFVYLGGSARESYRCEECLASMRERGLAQALLDLYGDGQTCLKDLCQYPRFSSLVIYEPGVHGPHRSYMTRMPRYRQSLYMPNTRPGDTVDGMVNQDLQRLTFDSGSLDLVITSDIMEHVRRPTVAFTEIKRVLKRRGRHVFTVPLQYPMPEKNVYRVDTTTDDDQHLEPPRYHGDGRGGRALVYTDFGKELIEELDFVGMPTTMRFVDATNRQRRKVIVFISRKSD